MEQEKWRGNVTPEAFGEVVWDLQTDLEMFMRAYMERITPDFVKLSIGLRAPQIYEETAPLIMKVPQAFLSTLTEYLKQMGERNKIASYDYESLAMTFFSATFGYTFLTASFEDRLTPIGQEEYIKNSVQVFADGISGKNGKEYV